MSHNAQAKPGLRPWCAGGSGATLLLASVKASASADAGSRPRAAVNSPAAQVPGGGQSMRRSPPRGFPRGLSVRCLRI